MVGHPPAEVRTSLRGGSGPCPSRSEPPQGDARPPVDRGRNLVERVVDPLAPRSIPRPTHAPPPPPRGPHLPGLDTSNPPVVASLCVDRLEDRRYGHADRAHRVQPRPRGPGEDGARARRDAGRGRPHYTLDGITGALSVDEFLPKRDRRELAAALNALLASPSVATWREGAPLDVGAWLTPTDGKTPAVVVSVAHLDDDDRALVLGLVLDEVLAWVRTLPGTSALRALVVFDELYGFLPPHPSNPPTKRPLVSLLKQARAYGVGMVLATQNPMDLDYRALSNAGLWFVGRLQTDADRAGTASAVVARRRGGDVVTPRTGRAPGRPPAPRRGRSA